MSVYRLVNFIAFILMLSVTHASIPVDYDNYYGFSLDIVMRTQRDYCSERGKLLLI